MIRSLNALAFILKRSTSAKELKQICKELTDKNHSFDAKYYRKKVDRKPPKKPGAKPKERILYPSQGRLKAIQEGIKENVLAKVPMPEFVQGGVRAKSNITNALAHKGR